MNTKPKPLPEFTGERISILAAVGPDRERELCRLLAHTNWEIRFVHSIADAIRALRAAVYPVVLCQDRLGEEIWLELAAEVHAMAAAVQIIVIAPDADSRLWAEVLNCGGFDLLPLPLRAPELYASVPMAWRRFQSVSSARCSDSKDEPVHHTQSA